MPASQAYVDIAVIPAAPCDRGAAQALARALALPYDESREPAAALRLIMSSTRLALCDAESGARLSVDFRPEELRRYRAGGAGGDPLRRAIGPGGRRVADATAGLGRDAVHLAALGYRVTAIERSAVAGALVQDGLRRARAAGVLAADNPQWNTGDARSLLPALDPAPETVYLDPMFPPRRKKSAAVRKEMRLLRLLDSAEDDAEELLVVARACARDRIVVKRPVGAEPLAPAPSAVYSGKLVRYDVYRTGC